MEKLRGMDKVSSQPKPQPTEQAQPEDKKDGDVT
jgi:hypothetical protein